MNLCDQRERPTRAVPPERCAVTERRELRLAAGPTMLGGLLRAGEVGR